MQQRYIACFERLNRKSTGDVGVHPAKHGIEKGRQSKTYPGPHRLCGVGTSDHLWPRHGQCWHDCCVLMQCLSGGDAYGLCWWLWNVGDETNQSQSEAQNCGQLGACCEGVEKCGRRRGTEELMHIMGVCVHCNGGRIGGRHNIGGCGAP